MSARELGPRPADPREISFARDCFEVVGYRTEYVVLRSAGCSGPAVFANRADADAFARRCGRTVLEERVPVRVRVKVEVKGRTGMKTLRGREAIEYARQHGLTLSKHTDPIEGPRDGLTPDEAEEIAKVDPSLVYLARPTPWALATHMITLRHERGRLRGLPGVERIEVLIVDDVAYTREEWEGEHNAHWEIVDGELRFQGMVPICESYSITEIPAYLLDADMLGTEWAGSSADLRRLAEILTDYTGRRVRVEPHATQPADEIPEDDWLAALSQLAAERPGAFRGVTR